MPLSSHTKIDQSQHKYHNDHNRYPHSFLMGTHFILKFDLS